MYLCFNRCKVHCSGVPRHHNTNNGSSPSCSNTLWPEILWHRLTISLTHTLCVCALILEDINVVCVGTDLFCCCFFCHTVGQKIMCSGCVKFCPFGDSLWLVHFLTWCIQLIWQRLTFGLLRIHHFECQKSVWILECSWMDYKTHIPALMHVFAPVEISVLGHENKKQIKIFCIKHLLFISAILCIKSRKADLKVSNSHTL